MNPWPSLNLSLNQDKAELAANLRRVFSGIVAGNVKSDTIALIKKDGSFQLHGDAKLMTYVDELLEQFVQQGRMKLPGSTYVPCYQVHKAITSETG